jgi:hypothetical protein
MVKLPEEIIGRKLLDIGLGSHFFVCMKTKAKIDMWIISNKKLSLH